MQDKEGSLLTSWGPQHPSPSLRITFTQESPALSGEGSIW